MAPGSAVQFTATPSDNTAALSNQIANYSVLIQTVPVTSTPTPTPKPSAQPTPTPSGGATPPPGTPTIDPVYIAIIAIAAVAVIVAVLLLIRQRHRTRTSLPEGSAHSPPQQPATQDNLNKDDITTRLQKLKDLYDKNLITKEDYEKKRNDILSQV
jgi:hypothetical protein